MKKVLVYPLALALTLSCFPSIGGNKNEVRALDSDIAVTVENNVVSIGNEYIERQFSTENNKLKTTNIINKRTAGSDTIFTPATGSEEFVINTTKEEREPIYLPAIDRSNWTVKADSRENESGPADGPASNLIDGDLNSIWHTNYGGGIGQQDYPYNVLFNLNDDVTFNSFSYTPRQEGVEINGNISEYELWVATSEEELAINSNQWIKVASGTFEYDGTNPIYVNMDEAITANQLKFVAKSAKNGLNFAGGAEFNLHEEKADIQKEERSFETSDLTLKDNGIKVEDTANTINNVDKVGKMITFEFEPYEFKGVDYSINEVIVMYEGDHFMRKFMEISVPNEQVSEAEIDYIDLESLNVNETDQQWTIPTDAGGVVSLNSYKANLGQPIYIQGMFFGCEFPVADTQIEDGNGRMRYYTGKTFEQFREDNQLTTNSEAATYVTWQTVAGAARGTELSLIQSDFFDYIDSIATPSEFRLQYNSWFDNMMLISDENILNSFIEVDKELNKTEVRPLDSYVVDDGWNNYNDTHVLDASRSGTTLNQSGFWEFNSKFPNGLTTSSELVHNFGSNFGVWVGPRGGYNFYGSLADILTKNGTGSKAGGSVDVADRIYVENFKEMAISWQKNYGVNYWKWDGFADNYQFNQWPATDGIPSRANNHMVGGYENMYHVTDLWEAWIDLFESVRESEKVDDINKLWISLTCYVNPSPWYLQWGNSVWMQCVGDRGESGSIPGKMDKMLTYRDAMYYDFINNHQFQFPLKAIYNHDPIYGREGTGIDINSMTDEQFKNYLYIQAGRGTGFWELYYSDSLMTSEKYAANAEFLAWAEDNFNILQHAKMIGGNPAKGVTLGSSPSAVGQGGDAYAYSGWGGENGIISMRNSDVSAKTLTFTLDRNIGIAESAEGKTLYNTLIHSYNMEENGNDAYTSFKYGDEVTVTLQPGEVRIWQLSTTKDTIAPEFTRAYSDGDKTITVKFNEKVVGNEFEVAGATIASVEKSVDDITYKINLENKLKDGETLQITAKDIKDLSGNLITNKNTTVTYNKDNKVIDTSNEVINGVKEINTNKGLNSNNSFTVSTQITTTTNNKAIVHQENGYTIGIDENGKAYVELNDARATSKTPINDGNKHTITGVKENNGILKLYIDGTLSSSAYNENNRYYNIAMGKTILGSEGFEGEIAVKVFDIGLGYDEVADLVAGIEKRDPLDTTDMTVEVSGTSEGDKANIFDNDATTFWTSEKAENGIQAGNPNLVVDLGGEYLIDRVDYTKRFYNSSLNIWKCTGNLRAYVLEVSSDNGNTWQVVSAGETFDDESFTSGDKGGTTQITFEPTKATHIRISGTASYHWQAENINKFMTVGDLSIYGEEQEIQETDKTVLKIAIDKANEITDEDLANVVPVVVEEFKAARDEANAVYNNENATQEQVNNAFDRLANAMQKLEFFKGDKTALEAFVNKVSSLKKDKYTESSWDAFEVALNNANDTLANENALEAEVNDAYDSLVRAFLDLRLIPNKDLLNDLINKAESLEATNYSVDSFKAMQDALASAKAVALNENATQVEVDNAKDVLAKAIADLKVNVPATDNSVSTPVKGGDATSIKTGDNNLISLFAGLSLLSLAGLTLLRKKD